MRSPLPRRPVPGVPSSRDLHQEGPRYVTWASWCRSRDEGTPGTGLRGRGLLIQVCSQMPLKNKELMIKFPHFRFAFAAVSHRTTFPIMHLDFVVIEAVKPGAVALSSPRRFVKSTRAGLISRDYRGLRSPDVAPDPRPGSSRLHRLDHLEHTYLSLRVVPTRVQFFQYETVHLSCGDEADASEWTIMRNTSLHTNQRNPAQNKSNWFFNDNMYYRDAGVYWCQSEEGECGAAVNITVTAGGVLLESPLLPINEGENVTLRCILNPDETRVEGTFEFFKDGSSIKNSTSGDLIIPNASPSDSGLYMCRHQEDLSAESPLEVLKKAQPHEGTATSIISIMSFALPVSGATLALLCLFIICLWRKQKG
ncbi:hypothetical protein WMY93_014697 [Mugilogobius chulae]|uniref:Ig-like domain-containing protein n=1 Tax=Mugilogobius chulae TaxID=88201 RepID=A0AAW0NZZ2_9GOBI